MLILSRKHDEKIIIDETILISIIDIKGDQVKLGIHAPSNVKIFRYEVFEAIQKENAEAASASGLQLPDLNIFKKKGSGQ